MPPPGIPRSTLTTSGASARTSSIASRASAASPTTLMSPSASNALTRCLRWTVESSTTTTLIAGIALSTSQEPVDGGEQGRFVEGALDDVAVGAGLHAPLTVLLT